MNKYHLLVDECVHKDVIDALKQAGLDVVSVGELGLRSSSDDQIFQEAIELQRVLLTFDRGFGNVFAFDIGASEGVVIVLVGQYVREEIVSTISQFFSQVHPGRVKGKLVIVGKNRVRIIQR